MNVEIVDAEYENYIDLEVEITFVSSVSVHRHDTSWRCSLVASAQDDVSSIIHGFESKPVTARSGRTPTATDMMFGDWIPDGGAAS